MNRETIVTQFSFFCKESTSGMPSQRASNAEFTYFPVLALWTNSRPADDLRHHLLAKSR